MSPRAKIAAAPFEITTQTQLREEVDRVACAITRQRQLQAQLEEEIQRCRDRYTADLDRLAGQITDGTARCAEYCQAHPDLFPAKTKSLQVGLATIGFRTGTPKITIIKGWTVDRALDALRAHLPAFLRTKTDIDREALIAERARFAPGDLEHLGLQITQAETFYIAPLDAEPQPTRSTV